jgi:hypothetical protein
LGTQEPEQDVTAWIFSGTWDGSGVVDGVVDGVIDGVIDGSGSGVADVVGSGGVLPKGVAVGIKFELSPPAGAASPGV